MDILLERVLNGYVSRISKDKSEDNIKRLLLMLGPIGVEKGASSDEEDKVVEEKADPKMIKEELTRKREHSVKDNAGFHEAIYPYVYDTENLKRYTDQFFISVFSNLKRKTSHNEAVEYVGEAMSYIIKDLDTLVRHSHGEESYITRESSGNIRNIYKSDPNYEVLSREGSKFMGVVVGENNHTPFIYSMKFSGGGILDDNQVYSVDCSKSILELHKGDKHKVVVTSSKGDDKSRSIHIKIEGALKGMTHYKVLSEQVPNIVFAGVKDFIKGPMKGLRTEEERIESRKTQVMHQMEQLEAEIERGESDGRDVSELEKKLERLNKVYSEIEVGLGEDVPWKLDDRKEYKFQEQVKKYEEHDPHSRWYNVKFAPIKEQLTPKKTEYSAPGVSEARYNVTDDDIRKIRHDMLEALGNDMFKKPGVVVPYTQIFDILYDSAYSVKDPTEQGFKNKFIEHLLSYAKKNNIEKLIGLKEDQLGNYVNEMLKGFQDKIKQDDRFKRLRENLERALVRRMKLAVDLSSEKRDLELLWHNPVLNREKLGGVYLVLSQDTDLGDFKKYIKGPTEDGFRKMLDGGDLSGALGILKELEDSLVILDRSFYDRLKGHFLYKVLELGDIGKKVDLFRGYREHYEKDRSSELIELRKDIMDDIRRRALEWSGTPERMKVKIYEKKHKKVQESEAMEIIRKRDPELLKGFDNITFG